MLSASVQPWTLLSSPRSSAKEAACGSGFEARCSRDGHGRLIRERDRAGGLLSSAVHDSGSNATEHRDSHPGVRHLWGRMIPKRVKRFSDKIMRKQKSA